MIQPMSDAERAKDISDVRRERDDAIRLLQRMLYAHRKTPIRLHDQARGWLERRGFVPNITR